MPSDLLDKREDLNRRTFQMMFQILIIFGLPAIAGYFVGDYLDTTYGIRPYGSVGVLACTMIFSWVIIIRLYLKLDKERKELEALEEAEEESQK